MQHSLKELTWKIKKQGGEHFLFVGATILSAGIHFIYSIYVKSYVAPLEYGMYSTCMILQTYMSYLQLGSLNAFNRDYPQLIGAGKQEEARKYRNTVFSFLLTVYLSSLVIIIFGIMTIGNRKAADDRFTYGYILSAAITVVTIIENYGNYRCRIDKGFKYTSIVTMVELFSVPVGIILVPRMGYYAIYFTSIIAMMIGIISYFKPSFSDFNFSLDKPLIKMILVSGSPLLINGLIWTVVNSIDKFVILGFIGTEALGIYGIAQNAFSYMVLIPSAMSQLFYVKMGKEYGASGKVGMLTYSSMDYTAVLAGVTSVIAMVAYFFLPVLVDRFMPDYDSGVLSSQILVLGLSIYAATLINGNILTILKQNGALLRSSVYMCVFNAICSIGYIMVLGAKIESVALGTATAYTVCAFIIIYQVYRYAKCSLLHLMKAGVLPVCVSLVPGVIIYNVFDNGITGFVLSITIVVQVFILVYRKRLMKERK